MALGDYSVQVPPRDRYRERFQRNAVAQRRFLITTVSGAHLVGVPVAYLHVEDTFDVTAATKFFKGVPFDVLAYAEELPSSPGARASDGHLPLPEPCREPETRREKEQKFKILDAQSLLPNDLLVPPGLMGTALLYFDVDHFKALNTKHTETKVDETLLPQLQRLIAGIVAHHGFAYREGGDEFIVLLPNCSPGMATAFAETLRAKIAGSQFPVDGDVKEQMTVSVGVAWTEDRAQQQHLQARANSRKKDAKDTGRNRVVSD